MKNAGFIMLALVMSAGVMAGCAEKKQSAEKAGEATVQAEKAAVETPVEALKEPPAVIAAPEEKVAEKAEAKTVEKAVEVKKEAVEAVQKAEEKGEEKVAAVTAAVETAVEKSSAAAYDAEAGAAIFKSKCAPCHGPMGKGTPMAPSFAGNEWIRSASDADISGVIKNGRDGAAKRYPKFPIGMPSNKGMADADIGALVGYLRSIN